MKRILVAAAIAALCANAHAVSYNVITRNPQQGSFTNYYNCSLETEIISYRPEAEMGVLNMICDDVETGDGFEDVPSASAVVFRMVPLVVLNINDGQKVCVIIDRTYDSSAPVGEMRLDCQWNGE